MRNDLPQPESDATALIEHVRKRRDMECRTIEAKGVKAASDIARAARRRARRLVRRAIVGERRRIAAATAKAVARIEARHRQQVYRCQLEMLGHVRPRVAEELSRLWDDPGVRAVWVRNSLSLAADVLPRGCWVVHHPPAWDAGEIERLEPCSVGHLDLQLHADGDLDAGLRVVHGKAVIDTTPAGLTANGDRLDGLLLGLIAGDGHGS